MIFSPLPLMFCDLTCLMFDVDLSCCLFSFAFVFFVVLPASVSVSVFTVMPSLIALRSGGSAICYPVLVWAVVPFVSIPHI